MFLNVTVNEENPISWGDVLEIGKKHAFANPFSRKKFQHEAKEKYHDDEQVKKYRRSSTFGWSIEK